MHVCVCVCVYIYVYIYIYIYIFLMGWYVGNVTQILFVFTGE